MTIIATLTITHSDDENITIGEQFGLVLTPEQLIPLDQIPAGAHPADTAETPEQGPAAPAA
jgi:hypothetical protein